MKRIDHIFPRRFVMVYGGNRLASCYGACILLTAVSFVPLLIACVSSPPLEPMPPQRTEPPPIPQETPRADSEKDRRETEAGYQEYLRRRQAQEDLAREETRKLEEKRQQDLRSAEEARLKEERKRTAEERRLLVLEARNIRDQDNREQEWAERDAEIFASSLGPKKEEALAVHQSDLREEGSFDIDRSAYLEKGKRDRERRNQRLDRADPERQRFYRIDSEKLFPPRFVIEDDTGKEIRLYRNKNTLQFMAFRDGQRTKREIVPVALPSAVRPVRIHLLDALKGRPGNYVLLDQNGAPVHIRNRDGLYRIVNIHTDGDVLLIVDLERQDLSEYHRVSVEDLDLIFE